MGIRKRNRKKKGQKKTVFDAEVYVRGERVAFKTFETRGQAEEWYEKTKSRFESGKVPDVEAEQMTFSHVFKRYKKERLPQLRQSTRQTQEIRFKYLTDSPVFDVKMCEFDDKTIDGWFSWLRQHPTASNPGRRNFRQELNLLRSVLNWHRDYIDAKFVVPVVKRHREAINFKAVVPRRPDYYMRPDEIRSWIHWLKDRKRNDVYWQLATFLVFTGARIGEACGLHWDAIDFDNNIASVIRTVWWDHHTKEPFLQECAKNDESIRILRLSAPLPNMLLEMRNRGGGTGPVFSSGSGGLMRYPTIQNAFNAGFKALDLPWSSTHICRHSFGTLALKATRDLSGVQAAMGHRDIRETQRYAKIVALMDGATNEKTARYIEASSEERNDIH